MFGFALWDADRRRLLIGRDRLGIKPLYTWADGRHFAFASEAKALFALPGVVPALDEDAVAGYLHLGYVAAPRTIFRGMRKLPPATVVTVENGRIAERALLADRRGRSIARPASTIGRRGYARGSRNRCGCRW